MQTDTWKPHHRFLYEVEEQQNRLDDTEVNWETDDNWQQTEGLNDRENRCKQEKKWRNTGAWNLPIKWELWELWMTIRKNKQGKTQGENK